MPCAMHALQVAVGQWLPNSKVLDSHMALFRSACPAPLLAPHMLRLQLWSPSPCRSTGWNTNTRQAAVRCRAACEQHMHQIAGMHAPYMRCMQRVGCACARMHVSNMAHMMMDIGPLQMGCMSHRQAVGVSPEGITCGSPHPACGSRQQGTMHRGEAFGGGRGHDESAEPTLPKEGTPCVLWNSNWANLGGWVGPSRNIPLMHNTLSLRQRVTAAGSPGSPATQARPRAHRTAGCGAQPPALPGARRRRACAD